MRDHATEHGRIEEESGRWNHEREAVSTLCIAASQRWRHDRCPRSGAALSRRHHVILQGGLDEIIHQIDRPPANLAGNKNDA